MTEQERMTAAARNAQKMAQATNSPDDWAHAAKLWLLAGDTQRYNYCLGKAESAGANG